MESNHPPSTAPSAIDEVKFSEAILLLESAPSKPNDLPSATADPMSQATSESGTKTAERRPKTTEGDAAVQHGTSAKEEAHNNDYDSDNDKIERELFLRDLYEFMELKGHAITKVPSLGFQVLDLYKLYKIVIGRGGMDEASHSHSCGSSCAARPNAHSHQFIHMPVSLYARSPNSRHGNPCT